MNEEILAGLADSSNPAFVQKSALYFEELKNSELGWRLCLHAISSKRYRSEEHAQFFCFQVIEAYVKSRYNSDSPANQDAIRSFIRMWPEMQSSADTPFILNKVAQVTALVFIQDFPHRWAGFFNDLLQSLSLGETGVDFYLRVLIAVDFEIADRDISRSNIEIQRNNNIKDAMRESVIVNLVDSWFQILTTFESTNYGLVRLCHQVIGAYILWIDINLIANDCFVPLLVKALGHPPIQESAADCIYDIISKGMEPLSKVKLVESFSSFLSSVGIWQAAASSDTDVDYLAKLGKIVNGMGIELIIAHNKVFKAAGSKPTESTVSIREAVDAKFELLIKFLGNEDDDVSASVLDFLRDYLHMLKAKTVLTEIEMQHVSDIVKVLSAKLRYDSEYNFNREGEDEICFKEFRKQLRIVFENLISVDKPLVIDQMRMIITNAFRNWKQLPFQDVEAALYLLHLMGESTPPGVAQFSSDVDKYTTIQKLLIVMESSGVHLVTHSAVILQYFEVVVRYEKFYLQHSEYFVPVLTTFLKNSGLFHVDRKVRSRCAYLLSRFIKTMKPQITPELAKQILTTVEPLMKIAPRKAGMELMGLSDDDQLYIFEVVGVVILAGEADNQKRCQYMQEVLAQLMYSYQNATLALATPSPTGVSDKHLMVSLLTQVVSVVGRLSKAFSPQETMTSCGCVHLYLEALETFLKAIPVTPEGELRMQVTSAIRQYFHRLVVCLDAEILPHIAPVSVALLKDTSTKSIQEYIPLINQIISKFKNEVAPFLKQIFPSLIRVVFEDVAQPLEENDETGQRERLFLKRQYYQFLSCIIGNNLTDVFPINEFALMTSVMDSVIQGCMNFLDPVAQKTCYGISKRFVELYAGHDADTGFIQFMYKNILPACFMGPGQSSFNMNDAQSILVVNETAACVKCMLEKRGEELLTNLRFQLLPSLNFLPQDIDQYILALQGNLKDFKTYVKNMFVRMKG